MGSMAFKAYRQFFPMQQPMVAYFLSQNMHFRRAPRLHSRRISSGKNPRIPSSSSPFVSRPKIANIWNVTKSFRTYQNMTVQLTSIPKTLYNMPLITALMWMRDSMNLCFSLLWYYLWGCFSNGYSNSHEKYHCEYVVNGIQMLTKIVDHLLVWINSPLCKLVHVRGCQRLETGSP